MYFYKNPSWLEVIACLSGITIASRFFEPNATTYKRWDGFLNEFILGGKSGMLEEGNFWPDFRSKHDSDAQAIAAFRDAYRAFLDRNYPLPET